MSGTWIICPVCSGKGTHVNPSIDANGITSSEMAEMGDEFMDDYMSGVYDVPCNNCGGAGKILETIPGETATKLAEAAADRQLAALEDGDFEAYSTAHDNRW